MGVRRRFWLASGAALALSLALPALASGATANLVGEELTFTALAGETNSVTVTQSGTTYTITDTTAPVTPMGGCAPAGANAATCSSTALTDLRVNLNDMNDTATIAATVSVPDVSINAGDGGDTVEGGQLTDDRIFAEGPTSNPAEVDTINGNGGDDRIVTGDGPDVVTGGSGNDSFEPNLGNDTLTGGSGNDRLDASDVPDGADTFAGGPGREDEWNYSNRSTPPVLPLTVTQDGTANDGASGEGDNFAADVERLQAGDGDDTITMGSGYNEVSGNNGSDEIDGGGGGDELFGGDGNDTIRGGAGDDFELEGDEGEDTVDGGPGDDTIDSPLDDFEADTVIGGPGVDVVNFFEETLPLAISLDNVANDGFATVEGPAGDNIRSDVEDVIGGNARDLITGSNRANELTGGGGRDLIRGLAGADGLSGGRGRDRVVGGAGRDSISGDGGADQIASRDAGADDVSCGGGADRVTADRRDAAQPDCEKVVLPRRRGGSR